MRYKQTWFLWLPAFLWFLYATASCKSYGDPNSKESLLLKIIYQQSQSYHYQPPAVDDEFSKKAFDEFLKNMDPGKRFYTQEDIALLEKYKLELDESFKEGKLEFFEHALSLLDAAVLKSESYFKEFIDAPYLPISQGTIELDSDKRDWPKNDKHMKDYWRKAIQYEFNTRLYEDLSSLEKAGKTRPFDSIIMDIRQEVRENMETWFKRLSAVKRSDRFELFVNTLVHLYDPHTDYLNPKEKEDFNISMSGKLEGIGARLQTEREYTKVSSIVPGGPAWKQKQLEANDIIMSVQQKDQEPVDIKGMRIDEVVKQIRGKKGTEVTLKVKKQDGSIKYITIVRDEVIIDESFARSAMLRLDKFDDNVGFIRLPKFYVDFDDPRSPSAAKDIAKEIKKLKDAGATSLILDLRNNGGGSLQEVVEMAGLFIPEGPIVQVKSRDRVESYRDPDPSVHFDGPLVILVNSNSASASEIISACLQDYKRAVIVGSESTFGKGTVQRFINLDRIPGYLEYKPLGDLKVTIQKYYRVSGGSVQLKGVEPDILLTDAYSYISNGEKEYEHPMPYDVIEKQTFGQQTFVVANLEAVIANSKERVSQNPAFQQMEEKARFLQKSRNETEFELDFEAFKKTMDLRNETSKKFEKLGTEPIPGITASNLAADLDYINMDSSRVARNEDFLNSIMRDIHIFESVHILKDIKKQDKLTQK